MRAGGPGNRGGLYKSGRAVARKRITLPAAARHGGRAPAAAPRAAARPPDRARGLRARARAHASRRGPETPTCESLCLPASAPGARHSDGWQNCQAAPPMPWTGPKRGPLAPPEVGADWTVATRPLPAVRPRERDSGPERGAGCWRRFEQSLEPEYPARYQVKFAAGSPALAAASAPTSPRYRCRAAVAASR